MASGLSDDPVKDAFENYLIVKKLIEVSEPKERLNLRRVSKYFDTLALEVIRTTGQPEVRKLKTNSQLNQIFKCIKNPNRCHGEFIPFTTFSLDLTRITVPAINKFVNILDKYTSLTLEFGIKEPDPEDGDTFELSLSFQEPSDMEGQMNTEITQLLDKTTLLLSKGCQLVHLTLDIPNYSLEQEAKARLPSFECLKTASFSHWRAFSRFGNTLFGQILKLSPNLGHLHLKFDIGQLGQIKRSECGGFAHIPLILFDYCRYPPSLAIDNGLTTVSDIVALEKIVSNGFNKIQHLDLSFGTFTHRRAMFDPLPLPDLTKIAACLNRLLALQCDSLTYLRLTLSSRGQWDNCMQIVLPRMNKLETLDFHCSNFLQLEIQRRLRPLRPFVTGQFPVLKVLKFFTQRYELGLFVNSPQFPSVESLDFEIFNTPIEPIPLGIAFPNVKRLLFWVFPPIQTVDEVLSKLVNLEDLTFGSHPSEFLTVSQRESIWESYTGGAKMLKKKKLAELFHQNGPIEEEMNESGSGDNELNRARGFGNLRKLKRLAVPLESGQEFYAILWLLSTGKFSELEDFVIHTAHPELILRTPKHRMQFNGDNAVFINAVQRAIAFA